jgi:hypothetical protein
VVECLSSKHEALSSSQSTAKLENKKEEGRKEEGRNEGKREGEKEGGRGEGGKEGKKEGRKKGREGGREEGREKKNLESESWWTTTCVGQEGANTDIRVKRRKAQCSKSPKEKSMLHEGGSN